MNVFRLVPAVFLAILFLFPTQGIWAHGGAHKPEEKKMEAPTATDSMYSAKEADPLADSGDSLDNIFSPTDLFTKDELVSPLPMDDKEMEESHSEHSGHQQPQVQIARHEWVSSGRKGYGTAVGITLFAGLAFASLTFMRPGE